MKILVIGGTGLISTALTQQLLDRGDAVTVLNRGRTPVRFRGDAVRLTADRTKHSAFERLVRDEGPWDVVIDMICHDPAHAASLVRACRGVAGQVIFCSTTSVYPKPADSYPVREDHRLGASFANGRNKIACERLCRDAEAEGAFRLTVIRPGHSYGEGGTVLHSLGGATTWLDRLRNGKPVVVHGDGNGLWSTLHVDDVGGIFAAAAGNAVAFSRTYNATGQEWLTWNQYYEHVAAAMAVAHPSLVHIPVDVLVRLAPDRAAQSQRSLQYPGIYDTSAAGRDLGFRQTVSLTEGMNRTIDWLESHNRIEPWQSDPEYDRLIDDWSVLTSRHAEQEGSGVTQVPIGLTKR